MAKVGQLTIENDWLKKNLKKFLGSTGRLSLVSKDAANMARIIASRLWGIAP